MGVNFANGGEQKQLVTGGHQVVWVSLNMTEQGGYSLPLSYLHEC